MKLSPEKDTFMVDLISGCIKSFSLISFNVRKYEQKVYWKK